ncbi:DnaA N-terminal domain-containing protein [Paenibacillus yonginensis]|nr:DnaA N-terminal domain-containing protein [Paenibacillus yonginensis]
MSQNNNDNKLIDQEENMLLLLKKLLESMSKQLSAPAFAYWFSDISIQELDIDRIIFGTDTQLKMEWLEVRYSKLILETLKSITGKDYNLEFVLVPRKKHDA